MTRRPRCAASLLALMLVLPGCWGTSDDKGDNGDSKLFTPKPGNVQDANTAGSRTTVLPEPDRPDAKAANPAEAGPK